MKRNISKPYILSNTYTISIYLSLSIYIYIWIYMDIYVGTVVKKPAANVGDTGSVGLIPGWEEPLE